jgi:hypothetical protein
MEPMGSGLRIGEMMTGGLGLVILGVFIWRLTFDQRPTMEPKAERSGKAGHQPERHDGHHQSAQHQCPQRQWPLRDRALEKLDDQCDERPSDRPCEQGEPMGKEACGGR